MKRQITFFSIIIALTACIKNKKEGCIDRNAINYDQEAKVNCCCNYNGFISFYTRQGYQNGHIYIYIDSNYVTEMEGIYIPDSDPSCGMGGFAIGTPVYLETGSHYYECVQSDSVILSGTFNTSMNSCLYVEVP